MLKKFLMKKMLDAKMKDVPQADRDMALAMIEKNPDLFKKIAEETQVLVGQGKDQMSAVLEVMQKYQNELRSLQDTHAK